MFGYLLWVISALCTPSLGAPAENCPDKAVLARREIFYVPVGGSLSLSCVVQHCGDEWTWGWSWKNSTDDTFSTVERTNQRRLTTVELSPNKTRLILDFVSVSELDEGSYGCRIRWSSGETGQGHFMYVNVTAAVSSDRILLHRILICTGATLCLPIVLGLVCCLRSKVKPQPLPRKLTAVTERCTAAYQAPRHQSTPQPPPRRKAPQKTTSSEQAPPRQPEQKTEVVYADISQDALQRQQQRVTQADQPSTVYSSLRFA